MSDPVVARFTYRAFISYSHADKAWADWLHKALETYRVPSRLVGTETAHGEIPRRLNPVFRDRDELSSAPELASKINAALAQSENLIVLCSPAAAASRWVNEEVLAYKRMGRAGRIFCLIVDGEPNASDLPGRAAEECFCPALRFKLDANGQPTAARTEPVAADARPGKDGKSNAKLKLIAGMLDVGFDALKQRELQRRTRRMTAIAALALVVMAITSALAVYALIARHHAVIAQHQAQVAQQAAERRQKQAEGLINFMLGNLSDKLRQESRLDVMQEVDDHAMAYFASLPPTDVNDTALAQRAKALEKIGAVRMDLGDLPGALKAFRASTAISSKLASAETRSSARHIAYSRTLAYIGMVHWNQGKLTAAQHDFEDARQVLQPSLQRTPNDPPLLVQLTYLDNNLDHVLAASGQTATATALASERLALDQRLLEAAPGNTDYTSDLGGAHNELGRLALQRGDLATAIAEYRADDAIETHLLAINPNDHAQQGVMLRTHAILARTLALAGDDDNGIRGLRQSVGWATQLSQFDPQDTDDRDLAALYSTQLAHLQRQHGDLVAARRSDATALTLLGALTRKDPTNRYWQSDYAGALTEQAAESDAAGNKAAARAQAQSALRILDPLLATSPNERETLLATMAAKLQVASLTADPAAARALREQALATMQAIATSRDDPRLLAMQSRAWLALGESAQAQPLIHQLWSEGYRERGFVDVLQRAHVEYPPNPEFQKRLAAAVAGATAAATGDAGRNTN